MRKLAIAALTISITIVASVGLLVVMLYLYSRPYELDGPTSPEGLLVTAHISDCSRFNWGADFYCDVTIRRPDGKVVATWKDDSGQGSREGVKSLVWSMRWIDARTLQFDGVTLKVPK